MSETKWAVEVGSRVHFVNGDEHVPAVVTDPANGLTVHLTVFPVGDQPFTGLFGYDKDGAPATWHWPEWTPVAQGDSDGGTGEGEPCEASDVPTADPHISRVGDQVLYVLDSGPYAGEERPATVVKVWNAEAGYVNLVVLLDGGNDDPTAPYPAPLLRWVTSVEYSEERRARTWHWPE